MHINEAGLKLIKDFEGCKLKAYKDIVGVWTIGYGHTGSDVVPGLVWTQEQADKALERDLERFEDGVFKLLMAPPSPNQFSAMVCFAYNVGLGALKSSTLLRCYNKHNAEDAAKEFLRWNKAGGVEVAGLTRRRKAESELFKRVVPYALT